MQSLLYRFFQRIQTSVLKAIFQRYMAKTFQFIQRHKNTSKVFFYFVSIFQALQLCNWFLLQKITYFAIIATLQFLRVHYLATNLRHGDSVLFSFASVFPLIGTNNSIFVLNLRVQIFSKVVPYFSTFAP